MSKVKDWLTTSLPSTVQLRLTTLEMQATDVASQRSGYTGQCGRDFNAVMHVTGC